MSPLHSLNQCVLNCHSCGTATTSAVATAPPPPCPVILMRWFLFLFWFVFDKSGMTDGLIKDNYYDCHIYIKSEKKRKKLNVTRFGYVPFCEMKLDLYTFYYFVVFLFCFLVILSIVFPWCTAAPKQYFTTGERRRKTLDSLLHQFKYLDVFFESLKRNNI